MPKCQGCEKDYDDGYNFCPFCGRANPQSDSKTENDVVEGWELAEIHWDVIKYGETHLFRKSIPSILEFWAEAIGPKGRYNAGSSPEFPSEHASEIPQDDFFDNANYVKAKQAYKTLVDNLVKDNWEIVPFTGPYSGFWKKYRFRRRVIVKRDQ